MLSLRSIFLRVGFFFGFAGLFLFFGLAFFLTLEKLVSEVAHVFQASPNTGCFLFFRGDVLYEVGAEQKIIQSLTHLTAIAEEAVNKPDDDEQCTHGEKDDRRCVVGLGQLLKLRGYRDQTDESEQAFCVLQDAVEEQRVGTVSSDEFCPGHELPQVSTEFHGDEHCVEDDDSTARCKQDGRDDAGVG